MLPPIVEQMRQLGFTGSEAQVYVYLLQHPLVTGYEVSKGTGLPRANVYQSLETLSLKDAATSVSDDPVRYAAVPPQHLLRRIRDDMATRCDTLEEQLRELTAADDVSHFWEMRDGERIDRKITELIATARHRIAANLWAEELERFAEDLRAARERGCVVILNVFGEAVADFAAVYRHEDPEKVAGGHVIALTIDFEEALVASLDTPPTGVATRNRTLVRLVEKLIRDEAYLAAIYERFPSELEAAFGPHLVNLRRHLWPEDDLQRLFAITAVGTHPVPLPDGLE